MPHFFINSKQIKKNLVTINEVDNYRHIAKSLRARVGEFLLLIDENQIQYETSIVSINSKDIVCEIKNKYKSKREKY